MISLLFAAGEALLIQCSDMPTYAFSEELIQIYPEAKIVLCSRDIDSWYRSFDQNVIGSLPNFGHYLVYLDPFWFGRLRWLSEKVMAGYFSAKTQNEMRNNAMATFQEHYSKIRAITPSDRLLEFNLGQGWKPLCEFLEVDIPDLPFPRLNETQAAKVRMVTTVKALLTRVVANVTLAAFLFFLVWVAWGLLWC